MKSSQLIKSWIQQTVCQQLHWTAKWIYDNPTSIQLTQTAEKWNLIDWPIAMFWRATALVTANRTIHHHYYSKPASLKHQHVLSQVKLILQVSFSGFLYNIYSSKICNRYLSNKWLPFQMQQVDLANWAYPCTQWLHQMILIQFF